MKVAEFGVVTFNCRICSKPTKIVYDLKGKYCCEICFLMSKEKVSADVPET